MKPSRAVAALVTYDVLFGQPRSSIDNALAPYRTRDDWNFLRALTIGSIRHWRRNEWVLSHFLKKKLPKKEKLIEALLLNSCHELIDAQTPDYAVLDQSVQAAVALKKPWAKKLLNGILRNMVRNKQGLLSELEAQSLGVKMSHPDWLVDAFSADWPDRFVQFLEANNTQAPLTLRFRSSEARDKYRSALEAEGIACSPTAVSSCGITIQTKVEVTKLPGYEEGEFYVQDEAPQLLAQLLDLLPQARILDACAAPGGKTSLVLERWPGVHMTAVDSSESRCCRLKQNLERLRLKASIHQVDVRDIESWWDGELFDCILLDVPCSATGVIRRHPEIKWARSSEDVRALVTIQRELIMCTWKLLAPGGILIFSTCSILSEENDGQIEWFLARHPEACVEPLNFPIGCGTQFGWQHFPTIDKNDGFFYSKLLKAKLPYNH